MTFLELEKECKRRRKRFYIILSLIVLLIILSFFIFYNLNDKTAQKKENNISNKLLKTSISKENTFKNLKENDDSKINHLILKKEKKTKKTQEILTPILDFNVTLPSNSIKEKKEKNITRKINSFIIQNTSLPSFDECLKKANLYLNNKEYKLALKWAKLANKQNKNDKRPWIISAKALYNLGKKDEAIKILEIYFNFSKDNDIKELLKKLRNNK